MSDTTLPTESTAPSDATRPTPAEGEATPLAPILFYCRDCKKLVDNPIRLGSHYVYECPDCHSQRVSFGSRQAVSEFYQVRP